MSRRRYPHHISQEEVERIMRETKWTEGAFELRENGGQQYWLLSVVSESQIMLEIRLILTRRRVSLSLLYSGQMLRRLDYCHPHRELPHLHMHRWSDEHEDSEAYYPDLPAEDLRRMIMLCIEKEWKIETDRGILDKVPFGFWDREVVHGLR